MSSTNRGRTRAGYDHYATPIPAVRLFMSHWLEDLAGEGHWIGERPDRATFLEPCAGGTKEDPTMPYAEVIGDDLGATVDTMDIREDSPAERHGDYLHEEVDQGYYDVIITNPPFGKALETVEKALRDVKDGGYVVMLLRLNFLGSQARFEFFTKHLPERIYVHHKRISFMGGQTDSIEYAHFVWKKGANPKFTKLNVI